MGTKQRYIIIVSMIFIVLISILGIKGFLKIGYISIAQETQKEDELLPMQDPEYDMGEIDEVIIEEDIFVKEDEQIIVEPIQEVEQQGEHQESQEVQATKYSSDGYELIHIFNKKLPPTIQSNLRYNQYPIHYDYMLITGQSINIREKPSTASKSIRKAATYERLNLMETVKGEYLSGYNQDKWYKVFWQENGTTKYGYVFAELGQLRTFQLDKMENVLNTLKKEVENYWTAYINNYKDRSGKAPLYHGKETDPYGEIRYQSAPAYLKPDLKSEFRYIADGMLVSILEEGKSFYKIQTPNFEGEYWVPKKYISFNNSLKNLYQAIIIDRKNQNQGTFEYANGKWNLISQTLATTGEKAKYKQETSLGYYMAIEKKSRFLYLSDITKKIAGYAPYAIRFNGGAYIHGVPVDYKNVKGKQVDPGIKEYSSVIGTVPRSHKCVRNYTSHAKFLYDWVNIGEGAVIVIE